MLDKNGLIKNAKKYPLILISCISLISFNAFASSTMTLDCNGSTVTHYCCSTGGSGDMWSSGDTSESCDNGTTSGCECTVGGDYEGCTITACG